jgi:hypothetical protein
MNVPLGGSGTYSLLLAARLEKFIATSGPLVNRQRTSRETMFEAIETIEMTDRTVTHLRHCVFVHPEIG